VPERSADLRTERVRPLVSFRIFTDSQRASGILPKEPFAFPGQRALSAGKRQHVDAALPPTTWEVPRRAGKDSVSHGREETF